jgi:hypothetical protein
VVPVGKFVKNEAGLKAARCAPDIATLRLREFDEKLANVRRGKESAIDAQNSAARRSDSPTHTAYSRSVVAPPPP